MVIKTPSLKIVFAVVAILIPVAYVAGRYVSFNVALAAFGALVGIPVGLFFGSFGTLARGSESAAGPSAAPTGNTRQMEHDILEQLHAELAENQALAGARKGSTTMYARIEYITPFWLAAKASGRLFVMQDAQLLNTIATAYYWLDQATHLETLAYEAKYSARPEEGTATAERLIGEARLLDGQLENSLGSAISAIDRALAAA